MLFKEWIKSRYPIKLTGIDNFDDVKKENWRTAMISERKKSIGFIQDHFSLSAPKFVIGISKETFMSLPHDNTIENNHLINWPDFTPIDKWLEDNMSDEYFQYDATTYVFANEEDAIAFKLQWC